VSYTLQVAIESTRPVEVVCQALEKCRARSAVTLDSSENYVLRVSGRDEYFLGAYPLAQFKVVATAAAFVAILAENLSRSRNLGDKIDILRTVSVTTSCPIHCGVCLFTDCIQNGA